MKLPEGMTEQEARKALMASLRAAIIKAGKVDAPLPTDWTPQTAWTAQTILAALAEDTIRMAQIRRHAEALLELEKGE